MKSLTAYLTDYAAYHRDRRNIATHFAGIPMIVVAATTLLSRPAVGPVSAAMVASLAAVIFYLRLDVRFGLAMAAVMGGATAIGTVVAAQPTGVWLAAGAGAFVVGWIIQFVGHWFEGRKPAFVDDLIGLVVGPLFVVAEAAFALGLRDEVRREIESRVGPTGIRAPGAPALGLARA